MTTSPIDRNRVLLTGENPYIRLSETDGGATTTDASFWRILFSPGGPGHVLFLQCELTGDLPRLYTDNVQMTRWLQGEIQGRINAPFGNLEIPAREASFGSSGDLRSFWTESINARNEDGQTALHGSVYLGGTILAPFLVEQGADINAINHRGRRRGW